MDATQVEVIQVTPVRARNVPVLHASQVKKFRFDFLKSLDPGKKKITTLEAQRMFSVVEETIRKVELIALLDFASQNMDYLSGALGSQLITLLSQHRVLLQSYRDLDQQKVQMSQQLNEEGALLSYISSEEDIERNQRLQIEQLSSSVKNIIRSFISNPVAVRSMIDIRDNISPEFSDLIVALRQLKDAVFDRLATTPLEERERNDLSAWLDDQTMQLAGSAGRLANDLTEAETISQNAIKLKNDEIRHVQQVIHNLEKYSEENVRKLKNESEKQAQSDQRNSENRQQKLQHEVTSLKTRLQQSITQHREVEFQLRKKKFKLESEVESWIGKYDSDMGERQAEFEEVERIYKEEKAQLEELEERFKKLETEYRQIMEERRIEQERKDEEEKQRAAALKAALIIQSFWRGYKVRKIIRNKIKKGKGGKGKGSGQKKKK